MGDQGDGALPRATGDGDSPQAPDRHRGRRKRSSRPGKGKGSSELDDFIENDLPDDKTAGRGGERPLKRRKQREDGLHIGRYVLDDVEVVGGDDNESDADLEIGYEQHVQETQRRELERKQRSEAPRPRVFSEQDEIDESKKLAEQLEAKYQEEAELMDAEFDADGHALDRETPVSALDTEQRLPSLSDPRLFLVKCHRGKEKDCVRRLMEAWILTYRNASRRMPVFSAYAADHLEGYVYLEARKESHVRDAIQNVRGLTTWGISVVPIAEMVATLSSKESSATVSEGDFVRLKRGAYKGDLAQIVEVFDQGTRYAIRVIPRIDLKTVGLSREERKELVLSQGPSARPPQRLFDSEEIIRNNGAVGHAQHFYQQLGQVYFSTFNAGRYYGGFLYRTLVASGIELHPEVGKPEADRFFEKRREGDGNLDDIDLATQRSVTRQGGGLSLERRAALFRPGDSVIVTKGGLVNLEGRVLSVEQSSEAGPRVILMPSHPDLKEPMKVSFDELQKHFAVGTHVKVIAGEHKDESGTVVKTVNPVPSHPYRRVILFSHLSFQEFTVRASFVTESFEMTSGRDRMGLYSLHDLVAIGAGDSVGLILQLQKNIVKLIDSEDKVQTVRVQEISKRRYSRAAVALDRQHNEVGASDVVRVEHGSHAGQTAVVKHVWRSVLFLHSKAHTMNSGFFVEKSKNCALTGVGAERRGQDGSSARAAPRVVRRRREDPDVGRTVVLTRGPYKGFRGTIKQVTDRGYSIELEAKSGKSVTVARDLVQHVEAAEAAGRSHRYSDNHHSAIGAQTPNPYGGDQSPWVSGGGMGSQTPFIGSQTPRRGSMTPSHGSHTPGNDLWNAGSATPWRVGGAEDETGASTPWRVADASGGRDSDEDDSAWYGTSQQARGQDDAAQRTSDARASSTDHHDRADDEYAPPQTPGRATPAPMPATPGLADLAPPTPGGHGDASYQSWQAFGSATPATPNPGQQTPKTPRGEEGTRGGDDPPPVAEGESISAACWVAGAEALLHGSKVSVSGVQGDRVTVSRGGKAQTVSSGELEPIAYATDDRVRVVAGPADIQGLDGLFVEGVESEAIIKVLDQVHVVPLRHLRPA